MSKPKNVDGIPIGKILMSLAAAGTAVGVFAADFNKTHIFNDRWMPHAKFHTGQTISLGVALGFATLYSLWRGGGGRVALDSAAVTGSAYHLAQLTAGLYPGTATVDPPGKDNWPQLWSTIPVLGLVGVGYLLERRRMARIARTIT